MGIKHKTRGSGTKINTSAVWAEDHEIEPGTLVTADIADSAITTQKIADNSITSAKIFPDCIIAADIATGAVTVLELADNSVGTAELIDNAVTNDKMADNSVNTAELVLKSVTTEKINDWAVTASQISPNTITEDKMETVYRNRIRQATPYVYTIWRDGSTYRAECNLATGTNYSDANLVTLTTTVEGVVDDIGGVIYFKNVKYPEEVALSPTVTVIEDLYGKVTHYPQTLLFQKLELIANDEFCWQMHNTPKAIYYAEVNRKSYFVYANTTPASWSIHIRAFNHDTETWGSAYTITENMGTDSHLTPTVGVLPTGKIIVFYRKGALATEPLYYRISTNAEDESSFASEQSFAKVDVRWSYSQPVSFKSKLVLFALSKVSDTQFRWLKNTTTDGASWTGWVDVCNFGAGKMGYFTFTRNLDIILTAGVRYTFATDQADNLYFAYSDDQGDTWKNADGSAVTLPIDETQLILTVAPGSLRCCCYEFPLLDDLGKPVVFAQDLIDWPGGSDQKTHIAVYSAPLGYSGTWSLGYAKDVDGNDLLIDWDTLFYPTLMKGRIEFLDALEASKYATLFRQVPGFDRRFQQVYKDSVALTPVPTYGDIYSEPVIGWQKSVNPIVFFTEEGTSLHARTLYGRNYP